MAVSSNKLEWCNVRIGEDMNWWVDTISDTVHWDTDSLGILDPRQVSHILEACEVLIDYGFDLDIFNQAFFKFRIDKEIESGVIRLTRTRESLLDSDEKLFALADVLDEDKGPYADFLDRITRCRVKLLNDLIDFEQKLTVDEIEEDIRERQNLDFMEGQSVHFFQEITTILEYVPEGFVLDEEDDAAAKDDDEDLDDIPDFEEDENIEEDETMKWDEEDEDEDYDEDEDDEEDDEVEDDDEDGDVARRGRSS